MVIRLQTGMKTLFEKSEPVETGLMIRLNLHCRVFVIVFYSMSVYIIIFLKSYTQ